MLSWTTIFIVLEMSNRTKIGLQLEGLDLDPLLKICFTCAIFQKKSHSGVLYTKCSYKFHKTNIKNIYVGVSFSSSGLRSANLLKKRLQYMCFLMNFAKFLGTLFLQNTSGGSFLISQNQEMLMVMRSYIYHYLVQLQL